MTTTSSSARSVRASDTVRLAQLRKTQHSNHDTAPGVRVDFVPSSTPTTLREQAITHHADGSANESGMAEADVLRMRARKQYETTGGNHLPSMIVRKHGKNYGPCSNRKPKGKHKKSGSARGNLCHLTGAAVNVDAMNDLRRKDRAVEKLSRWHAKSWGKYQTIGECYLASRDAVIACWPEAQFDIQHFEKSHRKSFVV